MTFLPIVGRELREGSRRPGTYWLRAAVVGWATAAGIVSSFIEVPRTVGMGPVLFWGLAAVAMVFCLLAGRIFTADCLSREKREGTLGFLFLTNLQGYDVVLGKLVATSVNAFYALIALVPLMAVPMLAGGVSRGELERSALVLANTFFLSLTVGLFASAVSREYRMATAANFIFFLLLGFLPATIGLVIYGFDNISGRYFLAHGWFYSCPIYTLARGADNFYRAMPSHFWLSLLSLHLLAWVMVLVSCLVAPRAWRDKTESARRPLWRWSEIKRWANFGAPGKQAGFRKKALDRNPYYWLSGRARLKPLQVWLVLSAFAVWWINLVHQSRNMLNLELYLPPFLLLCFLLKTWVAQEVVQRLGEDRQSGAFELLLPTPLSARDILRGQLMALRRQFLTPLVAVMAVTLFLFLEIDPAAVSPIRHFLLVEWVVLPLDIMALAWTGMLAGLTTRTPGRAVSYTMGRVLALPASCVLLVFYAIGIAEQKGLTIPQSGWFFAELWFAGSVVTDAAFGYYSWRSLHRHFRELAVRPMPFRFRNGPPGS